MIRLTLCYLLVAALMVTAVRRWFVALCGLVLLTVLTQHPDMPTNLFGIPGVNPWNATLLVIVLCWYTSRSSEPPAPAAPLYLTVLIGLYVCMVVGVGWIGASDVGSIRGVPMTATSFAIDAIVNPLKYLIVGMLFFSGARTRKRVLMALLSAVGSGICYALLVFKSMKLGVFTMDYVDARRLTDKLVGLYANDMAELFAFAVWSGMVMIILFQQRWQRTVWTILSLCILPPFVALKSRAGFLAAGVVGVALGTLRWRRILVLMPIAVLGITLIAPSVVDRVLTGVEEGADLDWNEVSAGRVTGLWPPVLRQIGKSPIIGHGRYGLLRNDCYEEIIERGHNVPGHPHNAYLEILLDAGVIGLSICLALMGVILMAGYGLMRFRDDPLLDRLGAVTLAAALAELSAGVAGSSFFPTQSTVPYLCVWGVALRTYCGVCAEKSQAETQPPLHNE